MTWMIGLLAYSPALNSFLIWFHIFSAVGWLGTAMFMSILMTPLLSKLTPSSRTEVILQLSPSLIKYVRTFATLTLIFGLALWFSTENGMPAIRGDPFGAKIAVGAVLAVFAYIIVETRVIPTQRKLLLILSPSRTTNAVAAPSIEVFQKRLRAAILTVFVLLSIVLVFMVTAHFYGSAQIIPGAGI